MIDSLYVELEEKWQKAIAAFNEELARIRTGRAAPSLLDKILVDYYGTPTPVPQMASVSVPEPRLLTIQPWDQSSLALIEKAIQTSDLGIVPQNDGKIIRLPMPALTEERRKEFVKLAGKCAEDARVAVRNIRRHGMDEAKKAEKDKAISEDDMKKVQSVVQEKTDAVVAQIDALLETKSKEILEV